MSGIFLFAASFFASAVEGVEAVTIVLAAGITRGWKSALAGTAAALFILAIVTAILGPALTVIPIDALRLIVGFLLLVFGLQWLRKAILRASGYKALHDEAEIYERSIASASSQQDERRLGLDWYAFTLSFKGVLLEGLEVVFIVITFGATAHQVGLAALGAALAVGLVVLAAILIHRPLTRVPENTLKFGVGLMLTSFGIFWATEGAGVSWPGSDAAILGILGVLTLTSFGYVALLRRHRESTALRRVA